MYNDTCMWAAKNAKETVISIIWQNRYFCMC